jgi:ribosome-associated protein
MLTDAQIKKIISSELNFKTSRSGGKGGQNVNKVETKVEIHFNIQDSEILTDAQKIQITIKYNALINDTTIKVLGNKYRSQLENKLDAIEKLIKLINKLLKPEIKRIKTSPTKSSINKKTETKKRVSELKKSRKKLM